MADFDFLDGFDSLCGDLADATDADNALDEMKNEAQFADITETLEIPISKSKMANVKSMTCRYAHCVQIFV